MSRPSIYILSCALALATSASALANEIKPKVIYGDDDRLDYHQVQNPAVRKLADATVALVRAANIDLVDGMARLRTVHFGSSMGLCPSEPFYDQETAAYCSGFLVAPDTVVTAGHCVRTQETCDATRFVFGFRLSQPGPVSKVVPADQVYGCARLVHATAVATGEDFAVIKLNRAVAGITPLDFRESGQPAVGDELLVMGHPSGLPLKIAGGAHVRRVDSQYFVANLDTYGGNSGSAVLNATTGKVEGILVRGEMDYKYENSCRVSNRCADSGCRGEDVTLFERVVPHLGEP